MSLAPILVTCGIDEAIAIITEEKENIKNLQNAIQLKEYFLIFKTHNTIKMMLGMPLFVFIKARLTTKFNKTKNENQNLEDAAANRLKLRLKNLED